MEQAEAISQPPAALAVGGRSFVILPPTPRDKLVVHERMRAMVEAKTVSPLDYVASRHAHLPPAVFALAVAEAIKLGSAPAAAPDPAVVWDQYATVEGVRWRLWYHVSRVLKDFKPEEAAELVTEDNHFDVSDAIDAALKLAMIDPKKETPAPPTGAPSSAS